MDSERIGAFVQHVTDKLLDTQEGERLFCEIDGAYPNVTISGRASISEEMASPMAFEYPNNIEVAAGTLPTKEKNGIDFDQNETIEAKFALSYVHELLHRIQSTHEGLEDFFEGRLPPQGLLHAELLVEAENYARTSQSGWRIAHDENTPYPEIRDYMLSCDPESHSESSYAVYAAYMKDKPLTQEHEREAMKLVVEDFMFSSANAQRYASRRVNEVYNYLNSGRLDEALSSKGSAAQAKEWMKTQPQIAGMGPDAADYDPSSVLSLGDEGEGSIFDIQDGFTEQLANPNIVAVFLTDLEKRKLSAINDYSEKLGEMLGGSAAEDDLEHSF